MELSYAKVIRNTEYIFKTISYSAEKDLTTTRF